MRKDLCILAGKILPAAGRKAGSHGSKTRLTAASHTEIIQGFRLFFDCSSPLSEAFRHRIQKIQDLFPDFIEPQKPCRVFILRVKDPLLPPLFPAPDTQRQHVILQNVYIFPVNSGHITPEHSENAVIGIIVTDCRDRRPDILDERVVQQDPLLIDKVGDLCLPEDLSHIVSVRTEIARDHSKIPVTEPLLPDHG